MRAIYKAQSLMSTLVSPSRSYWIPWLISTFTVCNHGSGPSTVIALWEGKACSLQHGTGSSRCGPPILLTIFGVGL